MPKISACAHLTKQGASIGLHSELVVDYDYGSSEANSQHFTAFRLQMLQHHASKSQYQELGPSIYLCACAARQEYPALVINVQDPNWNLSWSRLITIDHDSLLPHSAFHLRLNANDGMPRLLLRQTQPPPSSSLHLPHLPPSSSSSPLLLPLLLHLLLLPLYYALFDHAESVIDRSMQPSSTLIQYEGLLFGEAIAPFAGVQKRISRGANVNEYTLSREGVSFDLLRPERTRT